MNTRVLPVWGSVVLGLLCLQLQAQAPLLDYVRKPDASFEWTKLREGDLGTGSYVELILTSQTWKGIQWKHQLFIIRPSTIAPEGHNALLFISGGRWREEFENPGPPEELPSQSEVFGTLAELLRSPVAILRHVPHQPILDGKTEDDLIAFTFDEYLATGDDEWPLLLPMVKSVVRAMDTVQAYASQAWGLELTGFTVAGASKRGWTTWLSAAADPRITAMAPMVIDMLNIEPQLQHQRATWGELSYKLEDYTARNLHEKLTTPTGRQLQGIIDPYHYRDRLTLPKVIMLGTNDHYWPLDALNLYWPDLSGEKFILYLPNNGHSLEDYPRIIGTLNALHQHVARGQPLPRLTWQFGQNDGSLVLRVKSDRRPDWVNAWVATSPTRDFREARWRPFLFHRDGDAFFYHLEIPPQGYAALFGEAVYESDAIPYSFSTTVRIVPASHSPDSDEAAQPHR